jgi:carbonic anhydrase
VPELFFGMTPGNTIVFRNAEGRTATDAGVLKAALASQFLTHIDEIIIVHHTGKQLL